MTSLTALMAGSKLLVAKWCVEASFGGPVRSVRTLLGAYGPKTALPTGPRLRRDPLGRVFGSVCSSQGPQGPDRTAQIGFDPKFCHHQFRSIDPRTLHEFKLWADFARSARNLNLWAWEICLPQTHSNLEKHSGCFSAVDAQPTSTVKDDLEGQSNGQR